MLLNISDYLSLLVLILFSLIAFRFFLVFVFNRQIETQQLSKIQLIRDYLNNDEE
ncbi:MAG: hypothetical protein IKS51_00235 [Erysipelotrichaceae bacterium]|nr:hypothetical protein [Erysipelotrichaceae bacterium]